MKAASKNYLLFFIISAFALVHPLSAQDVCTASECVVPTRADLMVKYIYAKHREWGVTCSFSKDMYYNHLRVWNGFCERIPPKKGFEDFQNSFHEVLDSIKNKGYNPKNGLVLIDKNGAIRTGAHRVAACLCYNKLVYTRETDQMCPDWGFDFFRKQGLEEKYLDAMAIQYCELKPNTYILILFPSAVDHLEEAENLIRKYAKIVYKKSIFLNEIGGLNVILHAYDNEPFISDQGKISTAARNKAKACFPPDLVSKNPARIYLVESNALKKIQDCKMEIRNIYKISNHSFHTTDTHEQAIMLSRAFFNKNSIHFLNNGKILEFNNTKKYFDKYKNWIKSTNQNNEWFVVDGSAVMGIYGLRDCNDWDYIHFDNAASTTNIAGISSHNGELKYHVKDKDAILFDPDNYFFYKGIKFCSLPIVRGMKAKRNESKDVRDIALIDAVIISEYSANHAACDPAYPICINLKYLLPQRTREYTREVMDISLFL